MSTSSVSGNAGSQAVNKSIQAVAQRYCVDCKGNFDELSKITQVCHTCHIWRGGVGGVGGGCIVRRM